MTQFDSRHEENADELRDVLRLALEIIAIGALLHRHARSQGLAPPAGCSECAWGKVAGCWRCGSR